jgi:hypothetical protein
MGPGPFFAKHVVAITGLSVAAILVLGGCTGTETRHETAARQDLTATQAHYRPHDAKPPLPTALIFLQFLRERGAALLLGSKAPDSGYGPSSADEDARELGDEDRDIPEKDAAAE